MNGGIRKMAVIAYLGLCIYLLSQPSFRQLTDRAQVLDEHLAGQSAAAVVPALANALDISTAKVRSILKSPDAKPSDVVWVKLLEDCDARSESKSRAQAIVEAGMPVRDALKFFDSVERDIVASLAKQAQVEVVSKPSRRAKNPALAEALRSQPD